MERTPLSRAPSLPVTSGLGLFAVAIHVAGWAGRDLAALTLTETAFWAEPWRLVTSALVHVDVLHLAFNVIWLWVFGSVVERRFGHLAMAALVVVLATGSAAAEFGLLVGGVGLSGVGYGLFGLLWVMSRRDRELAGVMDGRTTALFVGWFFFCIATTVTGAWGVANVAHGMGALLGGAAGAALARPWRRGPGLLATSALVVLLGGSLAAASVLRPQVNLSADADRSAGHAAGVAFDAGRFQDALRLYQRACELDPEDGTNWYNLGVTLERLDRLDEALAAYQRAAELSSDERHRRAVASIHARRGEKALDASDPAAAVDHYTRAVAIDPTYALAWHNQGVAHQRLEEDEPACHAFARAVELSDEARYRLAAVRCKARRALADGRYEDARKHYREARALAPEDETIHYNLGLAETHLGNLEAALDAHERAAALAPEDDANRRALASAYGRLGVAALEADDLEGALRHFERALSIDADNATLWHNNGVTQARLGRTAEAEASFAHAETVRADKPGIEAATNADPSP